MELNVSVIQLKISLMELKMSVIELKISAMELNISVMELNVSVSVLAIISFQPAREKSPLKHLTSQRTALIVRVWLLFFWAVLPQSAIQSHQQLGCRLKPE